VGTLPGIPERMKSSKIADQVFAALGFRDASQFIMTDEEYAKYVEENPPQPPPEIALKEKELEIRREDNQLRHQREVQKLAEEIQLRYADLAFKYDKSIDEVMAKMESDKLKDKTARDIAAL